MCLIQESNLTSQKELCSVALFVKGMWNAWKIGGKVKGRKVKEKRKGRSFPARTCVLQHIWSGYYLTPRHIIHNWSNHVRKTYHQLTRVSPILSFSPRQQAVFFLLASHFLSCEICLLKKAWKLSNAWLKKLLTCLCYFAKTEYDALTEFLMTGRGWPRASLAATYASG